MTTKKHYNISNDITTSQQAHDTSHDSTNYTDGMKADTTQGHAETMNA